jgi:ribosomal protein S27AE
LRNRHFVGIAIDAGNPEESNPFCPRCEKIGIMSRLKQRLYLDDKGKLLLPQPPDADNFL